MGDLTNIMPAGSYYAGGATATMTGQGHSSDYQTLDYQVALIEPAKAMAMLVIDLLADGAAKAREVLTKNKPHLTKQEYLNLQQSL